MYELHGPPKRENYNWQQSCANMKKGITNSEISKKQTSCITKETNNFFKKMAAQIHTKVFTVHLTQYHFYLTTYET